MKKILKIDKSILLPITIMAIISILTIRSASTILPSYYSNLMHKQIIWYIAGFIVAFAVMHLGIDKIKKNIWYLYGIGNVLLLGLLLFATPINNSKCWFQIPGIGTFQPSEFMKIILIITLGSMINEFNKKNRKPTIKEEFYFLLKVMLVVALPSLLTFLQPDTGVVLIYLLITIVMLFISGIRYRWFALLFGIVSAFVALVLIIYFKNNDLFIKLFGTSFFLRVDRLLDWSNGNGYQLENGITAIGSGGIFGWGYNKTPIYFPEAQTDFIFAVFASNFGYIGSLLLIGLIVFFDVTLIKLAIKTKSSYNKYILAGILGMLIYQQIQNIGMTFGLMPITGITLPFISYGGSSLISYMIMAGLIFSISCDTHKYTNK